MGNLSETENPTLRTGLDPQSDTYEMLVKPNLVEGMVPVIVEPEPGIRPSSCVEVMERFRAKERSTLAHYILALWPSSLAT